MRSYARLWVIVILVFGIIARIVFAQHTNDFGLYPDTVSYARTGNLMLDKKTFSDPWRTPIYPVFLSIVSRHFGVDEKFTYTENLKRMLVFVTIIQTVLGIVSSFILFFVLRRFRIPVFLAGIVSILFVCDPQLITFERSLLTETFALFWMTVFLGLSTFLLHTKKLYLFVFIFVWSILGFLLRPAYLPLPMILYCTILFFRPTRITAWFSALSIILYLFVIGSYMVSNQRMYQYGGMTRISDINLLGKILTLDLPIPNSGVSTRWQTIIAVHRKERSQKDPWRLMDRDWALYNESSLNELPVFTRTVILRSLPLYIVGTIREVAGSFFSVSEVVLSYADHGPNRAQVIFPWLDFYRALQGLRIIVLLSFPIYFLATLKVQSYSMVGKTIIILLALSHTLFSVALSYNDFGRHLIVVNPLFFAAIALIFYDVWHFIRNIPKRNKLS
jgi:hypothetical protein